MKAKFSWCMTALMSYCALNVVLLYLFQNYFSSYIRTENSGEIHLVLASGETKSEHPGALVLVEPLNFIRNFSGETEEIYYARRPFIVENYIYDVMVKPHKVCSKNTSVVILVHSFHPKVEVRKAIRSTWGSACKNSKTYWPSEGILNETFMLFFIFGSHKDPGLNDLIWEENEEFGDVIQGNFFDSYNNMTLKSLLGFKYLLEFCKSPKFLIKSDDDMFLNLPAMVSLMAEVHLPRSIAGPLCIGSNVYRKGKWKLTRDEFPFDYFPPYEAGSAYIITNDLWKDIYETSFYVPYIHIDDVYITGILGKILNVTHIRKDGFAYWTSKVPNICDLKSKKILTATKMKANDLVNLWKSLDSYNSCQNVTHTVSLLP